MIKRGKYIKLNNEFKLSSEPCLMAGNRGFLYGEIVSFSMRACSGVPFFFSYYYEKIISEISLRGFTIPKLMQEKILKHDIYLLLQKSRIYQGAFVRVSIFRDNNDEFLISNNDKLSVLIEAWEHSDQKFVLNTNPLFAIVDETNIIPSQKNIKLNELPVSLRYNLMRNKPSNENGVYFLMNEEGFLVQSQEANIVFIVENEIYLPPEVNLISKDVMLDVFEDICQSYGYKIFNNINLKPLDLSNVDEVVLLDSFFGIRWVGAFGHKRYFKSKAEHICKLLNENI